MAPIHQGGQLEIDNVNPLTVALSKQGVGALPPNASSLSASLDQGFKAISSKMSSVGRIEASPSSAALRMSPPTNTWSGSTQPVTITAQPSSNPNTITASGTTVISTIGSTLETPCPEAENNSPPRPPPAFPNPNGLRVVEICVGVLGAIIIILLLLGLMRGQIWKWIRKAKIPISKVPLFEPYTMAQCLEPQSNLYKGHQRWPSNTSCNTNSRAESLQRDVSSIISVPTSVGQTMLSSLDPVYMSATPPAYSDLSCNNA